MIAVKVAFSLVCLKVIWTTASMTWRIQNFTEVCGLESESKEGDIDSVADAVEWPGSKEYKSLLDIDFLQSPIIYAEGESQQTNW